MEDRKKVEETRLKLFQEFKGKFQIFDKSLAEFTDFKKFRELKVELGDGERLVSVTLDRDKAEPGSYLVEVNQLAARSSFVTNGFTDPNQPVLGIGYIVGIRQDGEAAEIFVDDDHSSLNGISNLINKRQDLPFRASVIKDGSDPETPWRLLISSKKEGSNEGLRYPELYFLDGKEDIYIDNENESNNAVVKLDGFPLEQEGNQITDFLPGVNMFLKQARPDEPFVMTISEDTKKVGGKIKTLVDQVNSILEFINKQNQVDDRSDTRTTFTGDTSLQTVEYRLRNLLHEGFPVEDEAQDLGYRFKFLNQIGVEFEKNGLLSFKEDKFNKSLESDYQGVTELVTGEFGFASQLRQVIKTYTQPGNGLLAMREAGLRGRIKRIDTQIAQTEKRIEAKVQSVTNQFSRLQATISNMQKQQAYLSATMGGGGGTGGAISQLLGG